MKALLLPLCCASLRSDTTERKERLQFMLSLRAVFEVVCDLRDRLATNVFQTLQITALDDEVLELCDGFNPGSSQ